MADDWAFPEQPERWNEMTPECQEAWSKAFNGDPSNPDPTKQTRLPAVPLNDAPLAGSGGRYRAPAAPIPIGEAEHEPLSPPLTPSEGGGGGGDDGTSIQFKNVDTDTITNGMILMVSGCDGWDYESSAVKMTRNNINSNLLVFQCLSSEVSVGEVGTARSLNGRIFTTTDVDASVAVYRSIGPGSGDNRGKLVLDQVGFRVFAVKTIESITTAYYVRDAMPSQVMKVTAYGGFNAVTLRTVNDVGGTLGESDIQGTRIVY